MTDHIAGDVDNGKVAKVDFPFFKGRAGHKELAEGIVELSYIGTTPINSAGVKGTVDGVDYVITRSCASASKGMVNMVATAL